MRRLRKTLTILLLALVAAAGLSGCGGKEKPPELKVWQNPRKPARYVTEFGTMSTSARFEVVCDDRDRAAEMLRAAARAAREVDRLMSSYRDESDVGRLNRFGAQRPVEVAPQTMQVLRRSVEVFELTGGAFDVTYAPLRQVWRKAQREDRLPAEAEIRRALKLIGSDGLILKDGTARLAREGMEVDLGGIAKGYGIDRAARALLERGAGQAMVNIGGDMRLIGTREDGKPWKIGVRCTGDFGKFWPINLGLQDVAVATSGDYARRYVIGEREFSHIIDPRTGRPVPDVPSVTIIAPDAMTADALATGASVMGPQKTVELVNGMDGVECLLMARTGEDSVEKFASDGFSDYLWPEEDETGDSAGAEAAR